MSTLRRKMREWERGNFITGPDRPMPHCIHRLANMICGDAQQQDNLGAWVRAVPLPYPGGRLRAAWWILTGKAYAVQWPDPGDLERSLGIYKVPK